VTGTSTERRQPAAAPPGARGRLSQFGRAVLEQTLLGPVRDGRLRDDGWPYGLRAVVALGYLAFAAAALLVLLSGPLRRGSVLLLSGTSVVGLPDAGVWLLTTLFSFGLSLLLVAGLHAPWWLRVLTLLVVLAVMGLWSLRLPVVAGSVVWPLLGAGLMGALVVLVAVRARRSFAWGELALTWALVGGALLVGVAENRYAISFGFDQVPVQLQYTASLIGYLALPTAMLAGAAVAEVCVRLTGSATEQAQRLSRPWLPGAVLVAVLAVRGVQVGRQLAGRDPVVDGWGAFLPALLLVAAFALVGGLLLRVARRRGGPGVAVADLGEELGGIGLPVGAALILVNLPLSLAAGVLPVLVSLDPDGPLATSSVDPAAVVGRLVDPIRALVGVALLGLAIRTARRGRAARAVVLGCVGVLLVALARALLVGGGVHAALDTDAVNLVATAVVTVGVAVALVRRTLTRSRALALAGTLVLTALFASRTFLSDPVGALLGFSGAALVLFGLTWDLLTGASWGNGTSGRFPRPARVLLVLASSVVTMSVLAFAALVRDGSTTIYLDPYAELGDLLFGTALVAAAAVVLLSPGPPGPVPVSHENVGGV
jgi:hypothetical protein